MTMKKSPLIRRHVRLQGSSSRFAGIFLPGFAMCFLLLAALGHRAYAHVLFEKPAEVLLGAKTDHQCCYLDAVARTE